MELIDKEIAYKELSEYYHHTAFIQNLCLAEALDRVPVVDAVPIEFIRSEIKNSKGFYNSSLRRLLDAWAERKEKCQKL